MVLSWYVVSGERPATLKMFSGLFLALIYLSSCMQYLVKFIVCLQREGLCGLWSKVVCMCGALCALTNVVVL